MWSNSIGHFTGLQLLEGRLEHRSPDRLQSQAAHTSLGMAPHPEDDEQWSSVADSSLARTKSPQNQKYLQLWALTVIDQCPSLVYNSRSSRPRVPSFYLFKGTGTNGLVFMRERFIDWALLMFWLTEIIAKFNTELVAAWILDKSH